MVEPQEFFLATALCAAISCPCVRLELDVHCAGLSLSIWLDNTTASEDGACCLCTCFQMIVMQ